MLFGNSRESLRRGWLEAFKKSQTGALLTALETQLADLIREHPEYHAWLEHGDDALHADFSPESGRTNPFLHLSMHLSVSEQISIDQPPGIREAFMRLAAKRGSEHEAQHEIMDCLGEMLWTSQRNSLPPDGAAYVECVMRRSQT